MFKAYIILAILAFISFVLLLVSLIIEHKLSSSAPKSFHDRKGDDSSE